MVSVMQPFMDVESSRSYIDELYSPDPQKCLEAIICLKNSVIGSNRQKGSVIAQGVVPRLLQLLGDTSGINISDRIRLESVVTLGSLAKGTDQHVLALIDLGVVPLILQVLLSTTKTSTTITTNDSIINNNDNEKLIDNLIEACLRCLRTVFQHQNAPIQMIYQNSELVPCLLSLASKSITCQICMATILTTACKTQDEQSALMKGGAIDALACQLESSLTEVQLPALACLANMCYQNRIVSTIVSNTKINNNDDKTLPIILGKLIGRDKNTLVQLEASRCISYLHRAGALTSTDTRVIYRALPCLVRLCHRERTPRERIAAAETLAYLTEVDTDLQRLASISNHLIPTLAELLRPHPQVQDTTISQDMRQAAFRAFSSLGANDEDIRKKIIETENLMDLIVSGLQDPGGPRVRLAAVRCLHSLSRSVQQLRTTFQDHAVWRPLMQLLHGADKGFGIANNGRINTNTNSSVDTTNSGNSNCNNNNNNNNNNNSNNINNNSNSSSNNNNNNNNNSSSNNNNNNNNNNNINNINNDGGEDDLLTVASSTLCNLLLEFSPSKEPILESGGVELLCSLTQRQDPALRLNGIWALMNVAFQAEERVKSQIFTCLGTEQIFRLLADTELPVVMKTLGLLRNLLSTKAHIDRIMDEHAAQVMQAVILVLEDDHPADVKEQALCILANVADGDRARDHIMANEDVLKKLMDYMMHTNVKLNIAAIFCVCNLVWREEPGAEQRQERLRELGFYRILQHLRFNKDSQLYDKVRTALAQFFDP